MKHFLHRFVLAAVVFVVISAIASANDQTWAERQAEQAADRAERLGERIEERVERAGETLERRFERAEQRLEGGVEDVHERLEERIDRARARAQERVQRARERVEREAGWDFESKRGAHIRIGRSYVLPEGAVATEGIIVLGGDATIDGTAEDDVLVVGGRLRVGPKAVIRGDVATIGGVLDIDPSARIAGDVKNKRIDWPDLDWVGWAHGLPRFDDDWWNGATTAFTIGRFAILGLVSMFLVLVAPRRIGSIATRMSDGPVASTLAGFAGQILFTPALVLLTVALVVTIIGIPLLAGLPLLLAGFVLLWVAGYTAAAASLCARLRGADWEGGGPGVFDVLVGSVALSSVTLFGQLMLLSTDEFGSVAMLVRATGWTIEYVAWTVGLGAALTAGFRPRGFAPGAATPVVPPIPRPSPSAL